MEYLIIALASLLGSGLTFFSGFGLGTILVPVFAIFFPIELAIILTAIVHFLNNIFKLFLVGKFVDKSIIIRFGITSIVGSLIGAFLLNNISDLKPVFEYTLSGHRFVILPVKLVISIIILIFAFIDILPFFKNVQINNKYLPVGGFLSGFFGGFSGNQGALRTLFLTKTNMTKESFIATGVLLACLVDVARISIYGESIAENYSRLNIGLIVVAVLSAFTGAYFGNKLLKKITINFMKNLVAWMLILFSVLLGAGII